MGFLLILLLVPGAALVSLVTRGRNRDLATVAAIPMSIALLALVSIIRLFIWKDAPASIALWLLGAVTVAACVWRLRSLWRAVSNLMFIVPVVLVFTFTAAYVTLPLDPPGVTPYPRTFFWNPVKILGADDHLQYRTAQFAFHRLDLVENNFYYQWRITDRTPLAGLAFAEYSRSIGNRLPAKPLYSLPVDQKQWRFPDPYSYWWYRLFLMLGNASVVGAVGYLALRRFGRRVSVLSMALACLMPFTLLQSMMTYPKMLVASFLLVSFALITDDEDHLLAGVFAGLAYLTHPMALLYLPALGLILLSKKRGIKGTALTATALVAPVVMIAGAWHAWTLGTGVNGDRTLLYPLGAYTESDDPKEMERAKRDAIERIRRDPFGAIVGVRATSFAATFLSVPDFRCGRIDAEDKLYCLTTWPLPGALGFVFAPLCYAGLALTWRTKPRWWIWTAISVALLTLLMWGIDGRALVPEFLHPLWALLIPPGAWVLSRINKWWSVAVAAGLVVQSLLIALLSFNHPTSYADDGIGVAGPFLFAFAAIGIVLVCFSAILYLNREPELDERGSAITEAEEEPVRTPLTQALDLSG